MWLTSPSCDHRSFRVRGDLVGPTGTDVRTSSDLRPPTKGERDNEPRLVIVIGVAIMAMAAGPQAQTTTTPSGAAQVKTEQMTGEVMLVEGNLLLAKMQPSGEYRVFNVQPGRQFIIDGQARLIGDLKPGTVLNATVTTTTQPVTVRTTTV